MFFKPQEEKVYTRSRIHLLSFWFLKILFQDIFPMIVDARLFLIFVPQNVIYPRTCYVLYQVLEYNFKYKFIYLFYFNCFFPLSWRLLLSQSSITARTWCHNRLQYCSIFQRKPAFYLLETRPLPAGSKVEFIERDLELEKLPLKCICLRNKFTHFLQVSEILLTECKECVHSFPFTCSQHCCLLWCNIGGFYFE